MIKKYLVSLSAAEIEELHGILNKGRHSARKRKRAQALLLAQVGKTDQEIAAIAGMHRRGVEQMRQRFVEEGFEATLNGKPPDQHRSRLIDEEDEARLIALAGTDRPEDGRRLSLRDLSETFVTQGGRRVSHETIRRILKKNPNRGQRKKR